MSGKVILTEYKYDTSSHESFKKWVVRQRSGITGTVLEQNVTLERNGYGKVIPHVALDDFPQGLSEREAMLKLADWLHRISVSIEDHWSTP
ncbi:MULTISPECIES: hypothetical protein [unclassified Symbiopectobacterium]|uniref:hypothetical protein n=1 Tax=unclassified Symbiopectobacterium TaxID=2794573 RepID=UPI00222655D7|nr:MULTISPECIES: hypothetical protein [unclassified Symbiopectobacterium]MCW2473404.1 hypothetical protein [Candidatus Symbiopectobacterium sp. NZEC151]MCW2482750.1 hypothetical protein [Candidatus Symbiopectobacterium sp. NZEC135]